MFKRSIATLIACLFVLSLSGIAAAQDKEQKEMKKEGKMEMGKEGKMEMGKMDKMGKEMKMGPLKSFSCDESCGFMARSHDEKELTDMAMKHIRRHHSDMKATEKEVKGMFKMDESGDMKK